MEKSRTFIVTYKYTTTTEIPLHWVENAIILNPMLVSSMLTAKDHPMGWLGMERWEFVDLKMKRPVP